MGVLCVLVGSTMSVTGSPAQAVPEQVLQSVQVSIAPDGTITAVESQAVRKAGDADPTSETSYLQPTDVAHQLPVRVLTSYRLGERSGTDLRDIEGESGRVVIEVTVQNTTVRPEVLEYQDTDGDTRTATALVGTPLTVVGSAALGAGELARIVTTNDSRPTEVTDGVVSRGDDGSTRVQWAAMLAPPRLAPSATFTLVQETADFEVPTFDFSVQPGLVTDASLAKLIDSAFSDEGDSTLQLESRTISIIGSVNTVLADAGTVLDDIAGTLDRSASDLGQRTVGELRAGRDRVESSLSSTIGQLEQLDGDIEAELESTSSETLDGLNTTLDRVRQLLGDPDDERVPDLEFGGDCSDRVPAEEPGLADDETPTSVLYRMRLVGAQLKALTEVSGACTERIQRGLRRTIGRSGACGPDNATTAICTLEATISELGEKSDEIATFGTSLKRLADPNNSIAALQESLDDVTEAVVELQGMTAVVGDDGLLAKQLVAAARRIDTALGRVVSDLGQISLDGVLAGYGEIAGIAGEQLDLLGTSEEADSVTGRVDQLTTRLLDVCGLSNLDEASLPPGLSELVIKFLTGSDDTCTDVDDLVQALGGQLDGLVDAWSEVQDLTDLSEGSESPVAVAVASLEDDRDAAIDRLNLVREAIQNDLIAKGPDAEDAEATLTGLLQEVTALYDVGLPAATTPCSTGAPAPRTGTDERPVVNQLDDSLAVVTCNSNKLLAEIDGRMATFTDVVDDAADDVSARSDQTDAARQAAEDKVADLTGMLSGRIDRARRGVGKRVEDKIDQSRAALTARETAAQALLARLTRQASGRLSDRVGASTKDLDGANRQLQRDLASVLLDLGSRGTRGTGILGTLASSARRTGLSNADLTSAAEQADAFRSIRGQVVSDIRLQQEQTDRSLQLTQQFPSLGLDLPAGSRVLTVFSFHIEG